MSDRDETLDLEELSDGRPAARHTRRAPDPAPARYRPVPELLHAAGSGARELRQADRRSDLRRQADWLFTQRDASIEEPTQNDLFRVGTASQIHKMFKLPDGSLRLIVQGLARLVLDEVTEHRPYLRARVHQAPSSSRRTTGSRSMRCCGTSRRTSSRSSRCRRCSPMTCRRWR